MEGESDVEKKFDPNVGGSPKEVVDYLWKIWEEGIREEKIGKYSTVQFIGKVKDESIESGFREFQMDTSSQDFLDEDKMRKLREKLMKLVGDYEKVRMLVNQIDRKAGTLVLKDYGPELPVIREGRDTAQAMLEKIRKQFD